MRKLLTLLLVTLMLATLAVPAVAEKLTETPVTITFIRSENAPTPIQVNTPSYRQILERTGIDLQIVPVNSADHNTKMNALYAADDLPDIFRAFSMTKREMVEDGALLDLTDLIAEYAPNIRKIYEENPDMQRTMVDGRIYSLPMMRRDANYEKGCLPMIRMDLLEKSGLPTPKTWLELVDTLEKLGKTYDMIPWGARGEGRILGISNYNWVESFGADFNPYIDSNGVWHVGYIEPEYKDAITFLNDLVNRGILDDEYLTTDYTGWIEGLSSGKFLFWYDNPTFTSAINATLQQTDPDAYFAPLELLENPYGYTRNYQQPTNYVDEYFFSAKTKDPVLLVKFLDWCYGEEGMWTCNYGYEGETYYLDENGVAQWKEEFKAKYAGNDDAYYQVQSDAGICNNYFAPSWLNLATEVFRVSTGENAIDALYVHEMFKDNPYISERTIEPPLSSEQAARIQEIKQTIDDEAKAEFNKFVMGMRPMSEYDAFIETLVARGAQEWADILNEAEQTYQAIIAK